MTVRASGMPEEAYWETRFDLPLILDRLGVDARLRNVVEAQVINRRLNSGLNRTGKLEEFSVEVP